MSRHIFIDLDGTLTDPFDGITRCIIYALDRFGAPAPSDEDLRRFIGPPLMDTFSELLNASRAHEALGYYRERFADIGWQENVPYDGIHDALEHLRNAGATLYVATTKPWVFAEKIVDHFGMGGFFDRVYGSELDGTRTDKTELLAYALVENPAASTGVMVGDRKHDMIGGVNNDLDVVGVSYGYGSDEELTNSGATRIARRPADLPPLLNLADM